MSMDGTFCPFAVLTVISIFLNFELFEDHLVHPASGTIRQWQ
jgi:hypothetical protein